MKSKKYQVRVENAKHKVLITFWRITVKFQYLEVGTLALQKFKYLVYMTCYSPQKKITRNITVFV